MVDPFRKFAEHRFPDLCKRPPTDSVAAAAAAGWYDCISADPSIPQTEERETPGNAFLLMF